MRDLCFFTFGIILLLRLTSVSVSAGAGEENSERTPETAVSSLDVADGLEVSLFAAEPMMLSPSNIDVDHLGRVWVCEVVNYRRFANPAGPDRAEGDRILVLEDSDRDGQADTQHTFYQGRDVDSAHGVCVLGNRVIVSAGDSVFVLTDDNGDLKADRKEVMFTGIQGTQHDHGIHSFLFGPDGRLYFNFGNSGRELHRPDGEIVVDRSGNEVRASRAPYQEGMAFRCEPDGTGVDTLGWNFRNNWELCVDSFGGIWQSDNDDDGNRGVRINFLMEFGNYGYRDELTGAGWRTRRSNLEPEIPLQHWHLNDPGVIPNLLQTGGGSPTGILIYEGDQLPDRFRNQLIHCDAGPNVVRSYTVRDSGAGYEAEINAVLSGERDQWFRPSDVCVAPDGSLIVADWYDPGVGGHRQGDVDRGRLFRIARRGQAWSVPPLDLTTVDGAITGLRSPGMATRYLAFDTLQKFGIAAEPALTRMFESDPNPRFRARAMWLLGMVPGRLESVIRDAIRDPDKNLRMAGLRLARRMKQDIIPVVEALAEDSSPQVRRECAIALRQCQDERRFAVWRRLVAGYDGKDRWYLEALGIAADGAWDEFAGDSSATKIFPSGNLKDASGVFATSQQSDIVWRSRATGTPEALVRLIISQSETGASETGVHSKSIPALFRALDFQAPSQVQAALMPLVQMGAEGRIRPELSALVLKEALTRLDNDRAENPVVQAALTSVLTEIAGTSDFAMLVGKFRLSDRYGELLQTAQTYRSEQAGIEAVTVLLDLKQQELLLSALRGDDRAAAIATAEVMGNSVHGRIAEPLLLVAGDAERDLEVRRTAIRAASRVKDGTQELIRLAKTGLLDPELSQAAAAALHGSSTATVRDEAMKLFPLPPSRDNIPVPPISQLAGLNGDTVNGRLVFFTNGTCHKCHVVGEMGREIGPTLTEIGSKLSREAMFESVLYPSAGISHNFELWTVVKTDGTTLNGLLVSNTDAEVSIKGDDALVRAIPKSEVEELVKQKISLMPADLQKAMSTQEIADVVAFMLSLKKKE